MAQIIDERPYSAGLDLDSDERLIKPGDYPFGKNGRSGTSDKNFKGSVECVRGNVLRDTLFDTGLPYPFPTGINKVIGSIEDVKYQTIIYFMWNSLGNHRIIRYYLNEKVLRNVIPIQWSTTILNFQRYNKIWNGKIVYAGDQDYIIWTDGVNPVRKIRLDIGAAYSALPFGPLTSELIDFAKQPPQASPTTSIVASSVNTFTAGKGFQFATRYVYDDNSITTLSPYSNIQFVNDVTKAIRVSFSSGHYTVKEIQVLAREGNGVSGEGNSNPTWYIVKKIKKAAGVLPPSTITYDFTNTELKEPIARIDSDKLFESIPELAGCMELSETNQVILADITEGKNNPVITNDTNGITLSLQSTSNNPSAVQFDTFSYSGTQVNSPVLNTVYNPSGITHTLISDVGFIVSGTPPDVYYSKLFAENILMDFTAGIDIVVTPTGSIFPVNTVIRVLLFLDGVPIESVDTPITLIGTTPITVSFVLIPPNILTVKPNSKITIGYAYIGGVQPNAINIASTSFLQTQTYSNNNPIRCFKENSNAYVGIQYYDKELRSGGVIPMPDFNITSINKVSPPLLDYFYQPFIRMSIHNRPPAWAHYYSIVVKETNQEFGFYRSESVSIVQNRTEIILFSQYETDFTPQANDYFRIIGLGMTPLNPNDYKESSVFSYDAATKKLTLNEVVNIPNNFTFQIYRQKPSVPFYFEERFLPVGNPGLSNRFHSVPNPASGEQAQSASNPTVTPAIINVYGDTYQRIANGVVGYSKSYTSAYESDFWNKGRPAIEITNGGSKRLINGIRWGGQLFPNTLVNNMSVFDSGNYTSTNQMFGIIKALKLRGFTLKILQESNTSSAYLNRRSITNADGSEQLVLTDNLITQINPSDKNQGTLHPGSVILYNDDIYFFDAVNGVFVRDAENGQVAISDYGAQAYFRNLAEESRMLGINHDVICGYDEKTQQLFVSLVEHTDAYTTKSKTISYEEAVNRWKFFHDHAITVGNNQQPIEMYSKIGNNMFMFLNGRCWESNELVDNNGNPVYLRLFGENRNFVLTGVSNVEPVKVKIFLAHSIHTNRTPNFVLIKTPASTMYPLGMESELMSGNYALREGVYYADIKRDAFTRGTPANPTARKEQIAGGRPIRGNSMTYEMTWNGNSYVVVFTSGITVIPSEKS